MAVEYGAGISFANITASTLFFFHQICRNLGVRSFSSMFVSCSTVESKISKVFNRVKVMVMCRPIEFLYIKSCLKRALRCPQVHSHCCGIYDDAVIVLNKNFITESKYLPFLSLRNSLSFTILSSFLAFGIL